jgi:hypothetical protein
MTKKVDNPELSLNYTMWEVITPKVSRFGGKKKDF